MDAGAVNVKHDPKVDGYTSQDRKAVDKGPVGGLQGDLGKKKKKKTVKSGKPRSAAKRVSVATDLQVDGKDQGGGGDDGQGLVVGGRLAVLAHGLEEGPVRDEEDDEGDKDAVEQTDEEVLEVEQRPLLARQVELGEFQAKFVVHILEEEGEEGEEEEERDQLTEQTESLFTWSKSPTSRTGKLL